MDRLVAKQRSENETRGKRQDNATVGDQVGDEDHRCHCLDSFYCLGLDFVVVLVLSFNVLTFSHVSMLFLDPKNEN